MKTWMGQLRSHQNTNIKLMISLKAKQTAAKPGGRPFATTRMLAERDDALRIGEPGSSYAAEGLIKIKAMRST